jgi:16S rRNA G1207 methylase RsmC
MVDVGSGSGYIARHVDEDVCERMVMVEAAGHALERDTDNGTYTGTPPSC